MIDQATTEALAGQIADRRPEVVFHAAALKHLPLLEQFPDEAYKSNVIGTLNVLLAGTLKCRDMDFRIVGLLDFHGDGSDRFQPGH